MDQASELRKIIKLKNPPTFKHARVITVTSGKGGVGKSNLAVNLAVYFSQFNKKVIIFDADFGLANIGVMMGIAPSHNLSDVLYGNMSMSDIICKGPKGIGFISGGSGVASLNNLTEAQLRRINMELSQLDSLCDILIVDTGAGISRQVLDFVLSSPEVLLVTTPEPSSITDSYSLLKAMYRSPDYKTETKVYLVANKVNGEIEGRAVYDKINQVVTKFLNGKIDYLGMIPGDLVLEKCVRSQDIVSITSPVARSSRAFYEISKKLIASDNSKNVSISSFFGMLLKGG